MDLGTLILLAGGIALLLALIVLAVRIVPEYQRMVVFRVGRAQRARGPARAVL